MPQIRAEWGVALMVGCAIAGCGGGITPIPSQPSPGNLEIDGIQREWGTAIQPVSDDIWVGAMNDEDQLFVVLIVDDLQRAQQAVMRGITLWIDADGGKAREKGLLFPARSARNPETPSDGFPGGRGGPGAGGEPAGVVDPEQLRTRLQRMLENLPEEMAVIRGEDTVFHALSDATDIELELGLSREALVYEIKLPIDEQTFPFGVGGLAERALAVGFTTPELQRPDGGDRPSGGGGGGGNPGGRPGGMGRPGGGAMGMGRRGPARPEPLDVWVSIELYSADTP